MEVARRIVRSATGSVIGNSPVTSSSSTASSTKRGVQAQCQICTKKFGTFLPEHQCKRCARAVCDNCSKFKAKIIGYDVKPTAMHRICKYCKEESDSQADLRSKSSLHIGVESDIGVKWRQKLNEEISEFSDLQDNPDFSPPNSFLESFSLLKIKKEMNFSMIEMIHYASGKDKEDKVQETLNRVLTRLCARMKWKEYLPRRVELIAISLLCFCSEQTSIDILTWLYTKVLPDYATEFLQSGSVEGEETHLWITNRIRLSNVLKSVFAFSEVEFKAANAFLLNEARLMLSTLMVNDVNFHCFFLILDQIISLNQFESCEKAFLTVVQLNIAAIKDTKADVNLTIIRGTRANEMRRVGQENEKRITEEFKNQKNSSLVIQTEVDLRNSMITPKRGMRTTSTITEEESDQMRESTVLLNTQMKEGYELEITELKAALKLMKDEKEITEMNEVNQQLQTEILSLKEELDLLKSQQLTNHQESQEKLQEQLSEELRKVHEEVQQQQKESLEREFTSKNDQMSEQIARLSVLVSAAETNNNELTSEIQLKKKQLDDQLQTSLEVNAAAQSKYIEDIQVIQSQLNDLKHRLVEVETSRDLRVSEITVLEERIKEISEGENERRSSERETAESEKERLLKEKDEEINRLIENLRDSSEESAKLKAELINLTGDQRRTINEQTNEINSLTELTTKLSEEKKTTQESLSAKEESIADLTMKLQFTYKSLETAISERQQSASAVNHSEIAIAMAVSLKEEAIHLKHFESEKHLKSEISEKADNLKKLTLDISFKEELIRNLQENLSQKSQEIQEFKQRLNQSEARIQSDAEAVKNQEIAYQIQISLANENQFKLKEEVQELQVQLTSVKEEQVVVDKELVLVKEKLKKESEENKKTLEQLKREAEVKSNEIEDIFSNKLQVQEQRIINLEGEVAAQNQIASTLSQTEKSKELEDIQTELTQVKASIISEKEKNALIVSSKDQAAAAALQEIVQRNLEEVKQLQEKVIQSDETIKNLQSDIKSKLSQLQEKGEYQQKVVKLDSELQETREQLNNVQIQVELKQNEVESMRIKCEESLAESCIRIQGQSLLQERFDRNQLESEELKRDNEQMKESLEKANRKLDETDTLLQETLGQLKESQGVVHSITTQLLYLTKQVDDIGVQLIEKDSQLSDMKRKNFSVLNSQQNSPQVSSFSRTISEKQFILDLSVEDKRIIPSQSTPGSPRVQNSPTKKKKQGRQVLQESLTQMIQLRSAEVKVNQLKESLGNMKEVDRINGELQKLLREKDGMMKELKSKVEELEEEVETLMERERDYQKDKDSFQKREQPGATVEETNSHQQMKELEQRVSVFECFEKAFLEFKQTVDLHDLGNVKANVKQFKEATRGVKDNENLVESVLFFIDAFKSELDSRLVMNDIYIEKINRLADKCNQLIDQNEEIQQESVLVYHQAGIKHKPIADIKDITRNGKISESQQSLNEADRIAEKQQINQERSTTCSSSSDCNIF